MTSEYDSILKPKNGDEEEEAQSSSSSSSCNEFPLRQEVPVSSWTEAKLLMELAIPTIIVQLGIFVPPFLTASYVGRYFGSTYLSGFQLANLMGNLLVLSVLQGLYSASDTLSPQAFGAGNYRQVGLLAIRGFVGSLLIIIPINIVLVLYLEQALVYVGIDAEASLYASQWYVVYVFSLPFYSLYTVIWKWLSAQNVMSPLVLAAAINCFGVLPLALEYGTKWIGFRGTAFAIVVFQMSQCLLVLTSLHVWKPHKPETWPGIWDRSVWRDALHWKPLKLYFYLGLGGVIANSEWVYWETISLAIGTLGVIPMSVHSVATQVLMVGFMFPFGTGIALAIRMGTTLPKSVKHTKQLALATFAASALFFAAVSFLLHHYRSFVFRLFTNEKFVLEGCEEIWLKVCFYFYLLSLYCINIGLSTGLGMQWTLGAVTFGCLWIVGLPSAFYFGVVQAQSLNVCWRCIYPPYIIMNPILMYLFWTADWDRIAEDLRSREGIKSVELILDAESSTYYGSIQVPTVEGSHNER